MAVTPVLLLLFVVHKDMKVVVAKKGSSQTSRPSSAQSNRSESSGLSNVVNPFGHAKPREVLLQRSGLIKNPGVIIITMKLYVAKRKFWNY